MATTKKSAKSAKTNVNVFESVFANLSDGINAKKAAEELAAQLKEAYSKRVKELAAQAKTKKAEKKAEKKTVTPSAKGEKTPAKAEKKTPAKAYRYEQVTDLSKLGLAFKDYSEKAFAIISTKKVEVKNSKGEKVFKTATIHCQKALEELGGSYSPRLSCGEGYIFSKKKSLEAVKAALPFLFEAKKAKKATDKKATAKKDAKKVKAA